jgi:hypothetical protein
MPKFDRVVLRVPKQEAVLTESTEQIINNYNNLIAIDADMRPDLIQLTIDTIKAELVKRNVIAEDHEGPIDVS